MMEGNLNHGLIAVKDEKWIREWAITKYERGWPLCFGQGSLSFDRGSVSFYIRKNDLIGRRAMSTLNQAGVGKFQQSVQEFRSPDLFDKAATSGAQRRELDKALRLSGILQRSLDLRKMLEIFYSEAKSCVGVDRFVYVNHDHDMTVSFGVLDGNSLTYRLSLLEQTLGEATFVRKNNFTVKEQKLLEFLLCGLVYPLRNAIDYDAALRSALRDPMTGINNREAMHSAIVREVDLAHRHASSLALIAINVDNYGELKKRNELDTSGRIIHAIVDNILATVRGSDMVFRYSTEEFMVVLSNTEKEGAIQLAERIRNRVQATEVHCNNAIESTTVSMGVAWLNEDDDHQKLFQKVDQALFAAKEAGRNCVRFSEN